MAEPTPTPRTEPVAARRRAVVVAGHQGDVAAIAPALHDEAPSVRAAALGALHRSGALQRHHLEAALGDGSAEVRRRAVEAVAALHGAGPAAHTSLLPCLDDPDPTVVEAAAWACGEREPPEPGAVDALMALVTGAEDALAREAAVAALGAIGDPGSLPAILAATGDRATVRRRAVLALAPFEGPEVDAALTRALEDRDWQVRQAAEDLLGEGPAAT